MLYIVVIVFTCHPLLQKVEMTGILKRMLEAYAEPAVGCTQYFAFIDDMFYLLGLCQRGFVHNL